MKIERYLNGKYDKMPQQRKLNIRTICCYIFSTFNCEKSFDKTFGYIRELNETFKYRKAMVRGSTHESAYMIVAKRNLHA